MFKKINLFTIIAAASVFTPALACSDYLENIVGTWESEDGRFKYEFEAEKISLYHKGEALLSGATVFYTENEQDNCKFTIAYRTPNNDRNVLTAGRTFEEPLTFISKNKIYADTLKTNLVRQ